MFLGESIRFNNSNKRYVAPAEANPESGHIKNPTSPNKQASTTSGVQKEVQVTQYSIHGSFQ